ncbi:MAG: hypothetical protein R3C24_06315 [Cyanobacteriota/Melainabacteria group bacterium]
MRYDAKSLRFKVVCAEGDCNACTVMLGRACGRRNRIQACKRLHSICGYQVDACHIVTVEGLKKGGAIIGFKRRWWSATVPSAAIARLTLSWR